MAAGRGLHPGDATVTVQLALPPSESKAPLRTATRPMSELRIGDRVQVCMHENPLLAAAHAAVIAIARMSLRASILDGAGPRLAGL